MVMEERKVRHLDPDLLRELTLLVPSSRLPWLSPVLASCHIPSRVRGNPFIGVFVRCTSRRSKQ